MENRSNKNYFILGVLAVAVGSLLLLDNLNAVEINATKYLLSWRTLFIALGVYVLLAKRKLISGSLLLSLGVIFWLPELFNYQFSLQQIFVPSLLMVAGVLIVVNHSVKKKQYFEDLGNNSENNGDVMDAEVLEVKPGE